MLALVHFPTSQIINTRMWTCIPDWTNSMSEITLLVHNTN